MKKLIILTTFFFFTLISFCFAQNYVPGEVLVKWKRSVSFSSVQNTMQTLGLSMKKSFPSLGVQYMKLRPGMKVETALTDLKQNPNLEYAEPNYIIRVLATPNDPQFNQLWGLHNTGQTGGTADADIDAPEAWDIHTGSRDVVIAVIDSGVAYNPPDKNHPDLNDGTNSNIWTNDAELNGIPEFDDDGNGYIDDVHGWDFVGGDRDPTDYYNIYSPFSHGGHGTHVAGTIAALGNNSVGITGLNWYASIMPLRFVGSSGGGDTAKAIEAILYAVDNGAKVINASWGGGGFSQALYDAISYANDHEVLFVAAAGNGGMDGIGDDNDASPFYPASYELPNIISVAATDHNDSLAEFSNYGATSVDVAAPGVSILSSIPICDVAPPEEKVTVFSENFDSGLGSWTSWGTNNMWGISNTHSISLPYSSADTPSGNYLNGTESYITYNTPSNLVDKYAQMELQLRCELEDIVDYIEVGGNLGGNGFLTLRELGFLDGWFTGSTLTGFCFYPTGDGFCWYSVDLSPLSDISNSINIGFKFYSDSSTTMDGVYIDDAGVYTQDLIITGFGYNPLDGTSMAAPHVSGLAGLILARYPTITLQELKDRILNTVDSIPSLQGKVLMGGRINAYKALEPTYGAELAVDGGSIGLWHYDGVWNKLATSNPSLLGAYGTKLVAEFSSGLYEYDGSWTRIASSDCEDMAGVGSALYADFGGLGLWRYDGSWTKIATSNPSLLGAYGTKLVAEFSSGLYEYDGSWTRIASSDCEDVAGVGSALYADFGSLGLWRYDGSWTKVANSDMEDMIAVDMN